MDKKFKVSKGYARLYIGVTIFFVLWIAFLIYLFVTVADETKTYVLLILILCWTIYSLFEMFRMVLFDAICGSFSVNEKGITIYAGIRGYKSYYHPWESIKDCGTTWNRNANDGGAYCIYFATRHLTIIEKQKFLRKTRFDLDNIAWFQYSALQVEELFPLLPPEIATKVRENVELIDSSMNNFERRHHK